MAVSFGGLGRAALSNVGNISHRVGMQEDVAHIWSGYAEPLVPVLLVSQGLPGQDCEDRSVQDVEAPVCTRWTSPPSLGRTWPEAQNQERMEAKTPTPDPTGSLIS